MTIAAGAPVPIDSELARLAELHGVAAEYDDYRGQRRHVPESTVREVLAAMDVDASSPDTVRAAIETAELRPWMRMVEPSVVVRAAGPIVVAVRVPVHDDARVVVELECGGTVHAAPAPPAADAPTRQVGERRLVESTVTLGELPLGYHHLSVTAAGRTDVCVLIVAPQHVTLPDADRIDGWMLQLYAARSRRSWGIGDFSDLRTLVTWSGRDLGMGAVLINPVHAVAPVIPVQRSPYFPSSKMFVNPLYLDPDCVDERQSLGETEAAEFAALAAAARESGPDLIDRDAVWAAKRAALELLHRQPRARADAYAAYVAEQGRPLADFALFCTLAERYGGQWQQWPADLHDPRSAAVQRAAEEQADRVDFHCWLQFLCDEQLRAAQEAAHHAGMAVGVIADLAVGVDPGGADAWAMRGELAVGVCVGAPPDLYAKQGQNWSQPPLRPDRLRETGFAAFQAMLRSVLRHAGGIRIDHVLGLYRLFWIPPGRSAAEGTYVHYPVDDMLGVLVLEATRAGAIVIGEDLGTVPPGFREALRANGILGSSVLYFKRDDNGPIAPEHWAPWSLATVNTHDLASAVGHLTNSRVPLYRRLGLLDDEQLEAELRQATHERDQLVQLMIDRGVVPEGTGLADLDGLDSLVAGMHALLSASPCRLALAALGDAVGDPRQVNVPGTTDEQHPNWCLPLAVRAGGGAPIPIALEDVRDHPGVRRVVDAMRSRNAPGR